MSRTDTEPAGESVRVVGERTVSVRAVPLDADSTRGEVETVDWTFRCASGDQIGGPWTGVRIAELLEAAAAPADTTHVAVASADGYRACVPVAAALDGLLAARRDSEACEGAPRFVAPDVAGPRTVKRVARVDALALPPDADPEDREELQLRE